MVTAALSLFIALAAWGVSSPPGSAPDDDFHLKSIWCANGTVFDCAIIGQSGVPGQAVVMAPDSLRPCYALKDEESGSCTLTQTGPLSQQRLSPGRINDGLYPPVFYAAMGMLAGEDLDASVIAMRLANSALLVLLGAAVIGLSPRRLRPPVLIGVAGTLIPLGAFIVPSTNPSSWAVISAAVLWPAVAASFVAVGWRRWGLAGIALVAAAVGAGARSDAAVYTALAAAMGVLLGWRRRLRPVDLGVPLVAIVLSGYFYLQGRQGQEIATGAAGESKFSWVLVRRAAENVPSVWQGMFGTWRLGWLDTYLPAFVGVVAFAVAASLVFWGMERWDWRKLASVSGVCAVLFALPVLALAQAGEQVGELVQPRYLLPIGVILVGVAAVAAHGRSPQLGWLRAGTVAVLLAMCNALALHTNIRRYVTGVDVYDLNLNSHVEWWWQHPVPSPMVLWAVGSVAMAAFMAATLALVQVWSHEPEPERDEATSAPRRALMGSDPRDDRDVDEAPAVPADKAALAQDR